MQFSIPHLKNLSTFGHLRLEKVVALHKKEARILRVGYMECSLNVLECPTLLNSCCNIKIGTHIIQFRGSIGILHVLARYPVIFSLVGHITMAAEAPDHHIGDLGRLEEVRNLLTGAHTLGHIEKTF